MRSGAPDYGAEADHRVEARAFRQFFGRERQLESARDLVHGNVLFVGPRPGQGIDRAFNQPAADKIVETAGHYAELHPFSYQLSLNYLCHVSSPLTPINGTVRL